MMFVPIDIRHYYRENFDEINLFLYYVNGSPPCSNTKSCSIELCAAFPFIITL